MEELSELLDICKDASNCLYAKAMRCSAVKDSLLSASLEAEVDDVALDDDDELLLDDDELDESPELLMSGGGPGGGPPAGGAPLGPPDGAFFCRKDDSSDSETLPLPSVSMAVNRSSSEDVLLVEVLSLVDEALLDAA